MIKILNKTDEIVEFSVNDGPRDWMSLRFLDKAKNKDVPLEVAIAQELGLDLDNVPVNYDDAEPEAPSGVSLSDVKDMFAPAKHSHPGDYAAPHHKHDEFEQLKGNIQFLDNQLGNHSHDPHVHTHADIEQKADEAIKISRDQVGHEHPHRHTEHADLVHHHPMPGHEHPMPEHEHAEYAQWSHNHPVPPVGKHDHPDLDKKIEDAGRYIKHDHTEYAGFDHEHPLASHSHSDLSTRVESLEEQARQPHEHDHEHKDLNKRIDTLNKDIAVVSQQPLPQHRHELEDHQHPLPNHGHDDLLRLIEMMKMRQDNAEMHRHPAHDHDTEYVKVEVFMEEIAMLKAALSRVTGELEEFKSHDHPLHKHIHELPEHDHPKPPLQKSYVEVLSEQEVAGKKRWTVQET